MPPVSFRYIALGLLTLFFCEEVRAGAWTLAEDRSQLIVTTTRYATDAFFDSHGNRIDQTGRYRKYEASLYAEYGWTDAYTIGFQPTYQWVAIRNDTGAVYGNGLSDVAFFVRERIWHDDDNVFSLQELATIPGPYASNSPVALGYSQSDFELRGLFGHNGDLEFTRYFIDVEAAYRKRLEAPADEIRADFTLGIKPMTGWMVLAQSFNTRGLHNETPGSIFVTASGPDYDLSKLQLSGVVEINDNFAVQLGGAVDVDGRNTGSGKTLFFAVWQNF